MREDTSRQIAIAAAKARRKNGCAPEGPKEGERIDQELSSMALSILITAGAITGTVGLFSLLLAILNSGGLLDFLRFFAGALTIAP